jgi:outer membrane lipoprotein SlyB
MKTKWMMLGVVALLMTAGCKKSDNNANQTTNAPSATPNQTVPPQTVPAQGPSQQQADAANPANLAAGAAATAPPAPPPPLTVAAGTPLHVVLASQLSSRVNKAGESFQGSLSSAVMLDGEEAIPKGSTVRGTIVDAKKQGTFKGEADLSIRLTSITVRGKEYPITSSTYAATVKGKGKRTAVVTGGGAAVGALIGGLAGGGKGAAIGAGVGGGGGLAASGATGGENVNLPAESRVTFKLSNAITVDRPDAGQGTETAPPPAVPPPAQ